MATGVPGEATMTDWIGDRGSRIVGALAIFGSLSGGDAINEACANGVIVLFTSSLIGLCRGYIRAFG